MEINNFHQHLLTIHLVLALSSGMTNSMEELMMIGFLADLETILLKEKMAQIRFLVVQARMLSMEGLMPMTLKLALAGTLSLVEMDVTLLQLRMVVMSSG